MNQEKFLTRPPVLNYNSFREYLKDYAEFRKREDSSWTLTNWAQTLGLQAATSVTMIINGQRNCGKSIENAFINYFNFKADEKRHFQLLVLKDKTTNDDLFYEALQAELSSNNSKKNLLTLTDEQIAQINQWHFFALIQGGRILPLKRDQDWLRTFLKTDDDENLVEALDCLVKFGLLENTPEGFKSTNVVVSTANGISSEAIKSYHERMGKLGLQAIRKYGPDQRDFQGLTIVMKKASLEKAKTLVQKFLDDIDALVDEPGGDSVCQLNVQLFPLVSLND